MTQLEDAIATGDSREEAETHLRCLKHCLHLTETCGQRDPSLMGVARNLQQLIWAIQEAQNLRADKVEDAFASLLLEIKFCISSRE